MTYAAEAERGLKELLEPGMESTMFVRMFVASLAASSLTVGCEAASNEPRSPQGGAHTDTMNYTELVHGGADAGPGGGTGGTVSGTESRAIGGSNQDIIVPRPDAPLVPVPPDQRQEQPERRPLPPAESVPPEVAPPEMRE